MASVMTKPRLAFLGLGWIGRHRMAALADSGTVEICAIADTLPDLISEAHALARDARPCGSIEALIESQPDGIVIATPSALHAEQAIAALDHGIPVFCQKPLGRSEEEVAAVVDAARRANRLLGLDLSYRHTAGMRQIRELVADGALGRIFGVNMTFHNAYGPDKPWFYNPALSGGGCAMDLGVHLVDLALWTLGFPNVEHVSSNLFADGAPLALKQDKVEDYAVATLTLEGGAVVQIACSWRLSAGCDAVIAAEFYGTEGGAAMRNVGGSFYDFSAELYRGTRRETVALPPDDWGGRAVLAWATKLADDPGFDPAANHYVEVARTLDRIYGR